MKQEARSERSRTHILAAALRLFSSQGYRGTNMREIAQAAGVSTGNVYHQFDDKEAIFRTLLDEYSAQVTSPEYPITRALNEGAFPDDLPRLARATKEAIEQTKPYALLAYVDAIEFEGKHLQAFFSHFRSRAEHVLAKGPMSSTTALRDGVSPEMAVQFATRSLFKFFEVELLFGATHHYGAPPEEALAHLTDILQYGLLKTAPAARKA